MSSERKPAVVLRAADLEAHSIDFAHPWHPASRSRIAFLARPAGLSRTGINLVRLAPKNDSFTYHAHLHEEEWLYLLAGRAVIESGETRTELVAGDFVAFPTPQQPHQLHNESDEDVVYLTGGERPEMDVVDFPRNGRRLVRIEDRASVYDLESGEPWPFPGAKQL